MKVGKRVFAIILVVMLSLSSLTVYANRDSGRGYKKGFSDVSEEHWAYEFIELMSDYGIINGYENGNFQPSLTVSREAFAKMMVLTLNLELYYPSSASFVDVDKGDWAYPYVETGKYYLTGFKTTSGDHQFKPKTIAVREDMAVAIVKGLGIDMDDVDLSVLDDYTDAKSISPNLEIYVAAAIEEGIMIGSDNEFSPQDGLTRAEAATLLARLIIDEKVVYDEDEKVTYDKIEEEAKAPVLTAKTDDDEIELKWSEVPSKDFKYYKVVLSQSTKTPSYPAQGYIKAISDVEDTELEIEAGDWYEDGDFGDVVKAGETYYVAITAVYEDGKKTSNVVKITIPGTYVVPSATDRTPKLDVKIEDDEVVLDWSEVDEDDFKYYKVVVSKYDSTPSYPAQGYAKALSDVEDTDFKLEDGDSYNGGDFGGVIRENEMYYMTITAVYEDGYYTSNVETVTIPNK